MKKKKDSINVLEIFYKDLDWGFDSNNLTIQNIVGSKIYYNFMGYNYVYDVVTKEHLKDGVNINKGEDKKMKAGRIFTTKNGKETDIFHSYNYFTAKAKQRNDLAFNKSVLGELSERDKLLMRGYGQRIIEETQAFKYNNPNYVRKTTGKARPTSTTALKTHFFEQQ